MALPKLFQRIFWHNNTTPAINEDNLNAISKAVDDIDDRVIDLAGTIMEDVPEIQHDLEILEPAIENINSNVERAETAADDAEADALVSEGYAVGTQDGVAVTSGEYYQNNAKYYAEIANPPIENTVDFTDIITISDAINKAAKDVKLKIEPVQDLHGYTKPWVGGAGKNLFDPSAYSSYKQSDGSYRLTGSQANTIRVNVPKSLVSVECTASIYLDLSKEAAPTQVYICATVSGTTSYGNRISANSKGVTKITFTPQSVSDTIGLTFGSEGSNYFTMTDLQLEKGTEVTDYQPYTNICPISGWDNAKVTRAGKNRLPFDLATIKALNTGGTWNGNRYTRAGVTVTANDDGTYRVVSASAPTDTFIFYLGEYKRNGCILSGCPSGGSDSKYKVQAFYSGAQLNDYGEGVTITDDNTRSYRIVVYASAGAIDKTFTPMIRNASITDATYEPYQGKELTISLNGTRYGGTLDVTSGVLTVTHGIKDLGNFSWLYRGADVGVGVFSAGEFNEYKFASDTYAICSAYNYGGTISNIQTMATKPDGTFCLRYLSGDASRIIYIKNTAYTDATAFKTAMTGQKLVYELATPQTIQLTPTQVYLLYGYNTLFGDCGDISLTYDASGIIHIEEAKLDTETLKTIAAASSDFADFKARIAAL